MGLILCGASLIYFKRNWKRRFKQLGYSPVFMLFLFFVSSVVMNLFQEFVQEWPNGITSGYHHVGTDLIYHFDAAKALASGQSLTSLARIAERFEFRFSNITYFLYVILLQMIVFTPVIITEQFSLTLFYTIQSIFAITACMNVADYFARVDSSYSPKTIRLIWWLQILCISIFQSTNLLMRDVWIYYFLSVLMQCSIPGKKMHHWKCWLLIIFLSVLRSYSLILTLPVYVYGFNKRLSAIGSLMIAAGFFVGETLLVFLSSKMNVLWEVDYSVQIMDTLQFLLAPNILNQTQNLLMKSDAVYKGTTACNHIFIYYLLSIWNIAVLPLSLIGAGKMFFHKRWNELCVFGLLAVNPIFLYSIFYDGVSEPRHKLMILPATAFLAAIALKDVTPRTRAFYLLFIGTVCLALIMLTFVLTTV